VAVAVAVAEVVQNWEKLEMMQKLQIISMMSYHLGVQAN
jgi:arginine decarboxylase-like protein